MPRHVSHISSKVYYRLYFQNLIVIGASVIPAQAIRQSVALLVEKSTVAKFIPSFVSWSTGLKAEIKSPCRHTDNILPIDSRLPTCSFLGQ
jgi:hypothetical protein